MSDDFLPDPPRWRDETSHASATERSAAKVARELASTAPLTHVELARIRRRLLDPRPAFSLRFWLTVTGALLLGGATAASAARLHLLPRWITGEAPSGRPVPDLHRRASSASSHRVSSFTQSSVVAAPPSNPSETLPQRGSAVGPAEPGPEQDPDAERPTPGAHAGRARTVASVEQPSMAWAPPVRRLGPTEPSVPAPAPAHPMPMPAHLPMTIQPPIPPPGTTLAPLPIASPAAPLERPALPRVSGGSRRADPAPSEQADDTSAKVLAQAIRTLRVGHAADRALAFLDAHDTELLRGGFGHEALLVRVEALLALQRESEALRLLDETALGNVAASKSLRLTRAGLRAAAGRCQEALADYETLLAATGRPDERALRGRDACRKRLAGAQQRSQP